MTKPVTRYLTRPDGTLAYDDQGRGPLVLLVPGLGDLRSEYRFLTPHLVAAGYRVVTVDLRGHGESSVDWPDYTPSAVGDDLVALLRELDAGPAAVVGTSFAAAAAVWAAAEVPELVSSLVLVGPFVRDQEMNIVQTAMLNALMYGPWKVRAWTWYYQTLYPSQQPGDFAAYVARLRANLAEPGRFRAVQAMIASKRAEVEARFGEVRAPTLVVMGDKDPDFKSPEGEARAVATALSGEVAMIPGAGHYPHAEMPDVTAPLLLDFLKMSLHRAA
ncbi:MAG: alpha/beta hydrolase [Trueperaceae bacterium]|nr:alpha/beta hydrolase [Trueperaceae bacterium]